MRAWTRAISFPTAFLTNSSRLFCATDSQAIKASISCACDSQICTVTFFLPSGFFLRSKGDHAPGGGVPPFVLWLRHLG